MADYTLIDEYLGRLRRETRWLRDADEIADEVADHLVEAVDRRTARGVDRLTAQRGALTEFGDPGLVGHAFASSRTGGAAMPTQFTRTAGYALIASAVLWVAGWASLLVAWAGPSQWLGLRRALNTAGTLAVAVALLLGAVGILGVIRRHGGSLGLPATIGFWLFLVAGITFVPANTYDLPWGLTLAALALGGVLVGVALTRSDIAPRASGLLIGVAAAIPAVILTLQEIFGANVSSFEGIATIVGASSLVVFVLGETILGRWMAAENVDESEPALTT